MTITDRVSLLSVVSRGTVDESLAESLDATEAALPRLSTPALITEPNRLLRRTPELLGAEPPGWKSTLSESSESPKQNNEVDEMTRLYTSKIVLTGH